MREYFPICCLTTEYETHYEWITLTLPLSLFSFFSPTVWRIRYVSSERGTKIKTNYWIDVRQAVVSLPCLFCLCPASALSTSSLSLFHSVCFGRPDNEENKDFVFVTLQHCINSHLTVYSTVLTVSPHRWPRLNHWPLTFHCSCTLCFGSTDMTVALTHGSLSKHAWTKLYSFHGMLRAGILTWEYEGCFQLFLLSGWCWTYLFEIKRKRHTDVHDSTVYYLALWALAMRTWFLLPSDSVWHPQCNLTLMLLLHTRLQWS